MRSHDLNRLLDEPGDRSADGPVSQKISLGSWPPVGGVSGAGGKTLAVPVQHGGKERTIPAVFGVAAPEFKAQQALSLRALKSRGKVGGV